MNTFWVWGQCSIDFQTKLAKAYFGIVIIEPPITGTHDRFTIPLEPELLASRTVHINQVYYKYTYFDEYSCNDLCRLYVARFNSTGPYSTDEHGDLSIFRFHISSRSLRVL